MEKRKVKNALKDFEKAIQESDKKRFILRLYVAGVATQSSKAVLNIKNFCEKNLKGRYELEVIDIYQQPDGLNTENVIAVPTLLKLFPLPIRRFIGDMSDMERILIGFDIGKQGEITRTKEVGSGKNRRKREK